jgi:hypothetical protein
VRERRQKKALTGEGETEPKKEGGGERERGGGEEVDGPNIYLNVE